VTGLWLATGHHRNGVLLAAITATLLTAAITGQLDDSASRQLAAFSWRRFADQRVS
jgi:glycine oxidase